MLLVIDVGNSNIVFGAYEAATLVRSWRLSSDRTRTPDEYAVMLRSLFNSAGIDFGIISATIISSVVPPLTVIMEGICRDILSLQPIIVNAGIKTGIQINYDNPAEVGSDRIVNAVAGFQKYRCPLLIIDFGTATTFDYVNGSGEFCGGAIAPGLAISAEALHLRASKLPRVEISRPAHAIARNTVSSMQSGIFFGYVGLVEGIIAKIQGETAEKLLVVATGGLATIIATETSSIDHIEADLTLEGLRILYEINRQDCSQASLKVSFPET